MNKTILGVKITSHDTGAALLSQGRVVAIAEERLCRVKHSTNIFPTLSIEYCVKTLGVVARDLDLIVIDRVGFGAEEKVLRVFKEKTGEMFSGVPIHTVNHHNAHAAAAFFCSPFTDAAILIIDGAGEKIPTHLGISATETETLYRGIGNRIVQIQKTLHLREKTAFPYTFGIAKLYSLFSEGLLNFGHYNEGKMMGLAPFGTPDLLEQFPFDRWCREKDGHIICNPNIRFVGIDEYYFGKKRYKRLEARFRALLRRFALGVLRYAAPNIYLGSEESFPPVRLPLMQRDRNHPLPDKAYNDAAYLAQKVLEEVVVSWGKKVKAITGAKNLCVAGGVGLNIDANKRFLDGVGFERIFVQPAASDTGIALGCALWGAHQILKLPRFWEMKSASLGRSYTDDEVHSVIEKYREKLVVKHSQDIAKETAKLIQEGNIVGWFQGGAEYGPRALGNRSILCDARNPDMLRIINEKVKHRELWRPFAASVLEEKQREWFELDHPSPFMLLAAQVVAAKKKLVPSIVHVDGTCRIQSVMAEANKPYYELLKAFDTLTGVPLVLNTSFNDAGEPIVETPEDAVRCFLNTQMDYLVLEKYCISKK